MWPRARRDQLFVSLCIAVIALVLGQVLALGYGRDQGIYAVVGHSLLDGGVPYRDAWDFKPPGIFFAFAASRWLFGGAPWAIRAFECLGLVVTVLALRRVARRAWGRPNVGLGAGVLFVLGYLGLSFWHTAQPEGFGGMLTVWALACVAGRRVGVRGLIAAGALIGGAALFKPTLAAVGAAVALELVWRRRSGWPLAGLLLGAALPFGACFAWFSARGGAAALGDALFRFAPGYTAIGWHELRGPQVVWETLRRAWSFTPALSLAGLPLLLFGHAFRKRLVATLVVASALELCGVALQAKYFAYHYAGIHPLVALLAALGFAQFFRGARRRPARVVLAIAAAGVFATAFVARGALAGQTKLAFDHLRLLGGGFADTALADELARAADVNPAANRAVAHYLAARLPADETLLVWGFEPVIHELAGRAPASRFIYNVPLRTPWSAARYRPELIAELRARPPGAIVVEHNDNLGWVTGTDEDSAGALWGFPELVAFMHERYSLAAQIEDFDVYLADRLDEGPE